MLLTNDVRERDAKRQDLEAAMAEFLANGGTITEVTAPLRRTEIDKPTGLREVLLRRHATSAKGIEMKAKRERAKALRACGLSYAEIAQRMEVTVRCVRKLLR